ncbi:MAG: hypothetical protein A3F84_04305 [Candidatus Handelsmanbacteria bacterium RIFCSPLOWO2_12_FULL_64_10]|uniref:Pyruvate/ketoisovalerate oxidoreductase catalytic domain-containing protein n=1 Tax=Handelsmanbacteria sp. (strain RIFCSPLOWO2_12_FULL_64_10) TaxID=1817868 RepID=A0A1F6D374_HANXR|nr:MAG: hypothetical protein A3F84_04305 [Candidatus Handelsmanbacteria bacterium RIFCSPLOWO2_12_FULL_64_10]
MTRTEVRFAGFGGQGIILAGYLVGKAAALYDGQHAVLTQAYGPEARGGACNADVVLSDGPVDYPEVTTPSILVVMSQEAVATFLPSLSEDGLAVFDSGLVDLPWKGRQQSVAASGIADGLGRRIVANVVMLGYFAATTGLVSRDALEQAIRTTVRPQTIDLNLRALEAGFSEGVAA